jgi:hemerythrin-like domain-containing protein
MPVSLGAGPLAGFDRPIDLLMDCHRRIERFLDVLLRVAEVAQANAVKELPLDQEHREALETAMNYFQAAAPRHTQDEEHSLFPLLKQHEDDPAIRQALREIERLETEHRAADALHAETNRLAERLLSEGRLPAADAALLCDTLRSLKVLYLRHIEAEDHGVFPLARRALSDEQLQRVGREMAARRAADGDERSSLTT